MLIEEPLSWIEDTHRVVKTEKVSETTTEFELIDDIATQTTYFRAERETVQKHTVLETRTLFLQ